MTEDDERGDPDFQRESIFHAETLDMADLKDENKILREELRMCQKIVDYLKVEIGDIKVENAIMRAVFSD